MDQQLKEDLIKASKSIRKKFKELKKTLHLEEELNQKRVEPLLKPLGTLIDLTQEKANELKELKREQPATKVEEVKKRGRRETNEDEEDFPYYETVYQSQEDEAKDWAAWREYTARLGPLSKEYLTGLITDTNGKESKYDQTFGVRASGLMNAWTIGNKVIEFDKDDYIHIGQKMFRGSRGLFELLFKKRPNEETFNAEHLKTYKEILVETSAHRQQYNPRAKIASSGGKKYTTIIKKLFEVRGEGLLPVTGNKIDYIHWEDPNELVERLALLFASQGAGNEGHKVEIASIEEELREAGYIQ